MLRRSLFALIGLTLIGTNAGASPHSYSHHYHHHARAGAATAHHAHFSSRYADGRGEVVAHPADCPRTLFCGCGAAHDLGLSDRSLWLVRSWYKFPRAAAAPGMAALWGTRHVAVIRSLNGDGTASVYDANSGGGLTRVHRVSLAGLTIVDPHGGGGSMLASRSRVPLDQPHVAMRVAYRHVRVAYRHRSLTRDAIAGNWPAYRHARQFHQPEPTWREAHAEMFVSFVH
jgi:hypothetical protein